VSKSANLGKRDGEEDRETHLPRASGGLPASSALRLMGMAMELWEERERVEGREWRRAGREGGFDGRRAEEDAVCTVAVRDEGTVYVRVSRVKR
jgi:hypothetical protein